MKLNQFMKSMLALGVLVCMVSTASAQFDLDVKNATSCNLIVKFINDDGTGTCTTCSNWGNSPSMTFNTYSCGATSGAVFLVGVSDGTTASVAVGDCSFTSCGWCLGIPTSTTLTACGAIWTVDYYPPGAITPNAFVYIY